MSYTVRSAKSLRQGLAIASAQGIKTGGDKFVIAVNSLLATFSDIGLPQKERDDFVNWAHAAIEQANGDIFAMLDEDGIIPEYVPRIEAPELDALWAAI